MIQLRPGELVAVSPALQGVIEIGLKGSVEVGHPEEDGQGQQDPKGKEEVDERLCSVAVGHVFP